MKKNDKHCDNGPGCLYKHGSAGAGSSNDKCARPTRLSPR
jgi:hypothetical protein